MVSTAAALKYLLVTIIIVIHLHFGIRRVTWQWDLNFISYLDLISGFSLLILYYPFPGLQIIFRLTPVKLSSQTYFCSDISHFWPDKHR